MTSESKKSNLKNLLGKVNGIKLVIDELAQFDLEGTAIHNEFIEITNKYKNFQVEVQKGILYSEQQDVKHGRLVNDIINFLDRNDTYFSSLEKLDDHKKKLEKRLKRRSSEVSCFVSQNFYLARRKEQSSLKNEEPHQKEDIIGHIMEMLISKISDETDDDYGINDNLEEEENGNQYNGEPLSEKKVILLTGTLGSGKTLICYKLAQEILSKSGNGELPCDVIFQEAKDFFNGNEISAFNFKPNKWINKNINENQGYLDGRLKVIVFDGLEDFIDTDTNQPQKMKIRKFFSSLIEMERNDVTIIVTCKSKYIDQKTLEKIKDDVSIYELCGLSIDQQKQFVETYLKKQDRKRTDLIQRVYASIDDFYNDTVHKYIYETIQIPLFLKIATKLLIKDSLYREKAQNKYEFTYDLIFNYFEDFFDDKGLGEGATLSLQKLYNKLGFITQSEPKGIDIDDVRIKSELTNFLEKSGKVIKDRKKKIEEVSNFCTIKEDRLTFNNEIFRDFFCAQYIWEAFKKNVKETNDNDFQSFLSLFESVSITNLLSNDILQYLKYLINSSEDKPVKEKCSSLFYDFQSKLFSENFKNKEKENSIKEKEITNRFLIYWYLFKGLSNDNKIIHIGKGQKKTHPVWSFIGKLKLDKDLVLDLSNEQIKDHEFKNANLSNLTFRDATIEDVKFISCDLENIEFLNCILTKINFSKSKISTLKLNNCEITNSIFFENCELEKVKFEDCNIEKITLSKSKVMCLEIHDCIITDQISFKNCELIDEAKKEENRSSNQLDQISFHISNSQFKKINLYQVELAVSKIDNCKISFFESDFSSFKKLEFKSNPVNSFMISSSNIDDCEIEFCKIENINCNMVKIPNILLDQNTCINLIFNRCDLNIKEFFGIIIEERTKIEYCKIRLKEGKEDLLLEDFQNGEIDTNELVIIDSYDE